MCEEMTGWDLSCRPTPTYETVPVLYCCTLETFLSDGNMAIPCHPWDKKMNGQQKGLLLRTQTVIPSPWVEKELLAVF